ncbi:MAG: RidA family protein [Candidatus Dormibacteria bacterium]
MSATSRLRELGITLPEPSTPAASYVMSKRSHDLLFLSGHIARRDGKVVLGRFGEDLEREDGYALARLVAIDLLASASAALGSPDRIASVVKVTGFVSSAPAFFDQPFVVNGASELLVEVLGDKGKHARSAVGVAALPLGAALEIEAVVASE